MKFNIVSNISNGCGLQRDYELLKAELEDRGHAVCGVQFNRRILLCPAADVNIFLEVAEPAFFRFASQQWIVPNPEWWFRGWTSLPWTRVLTKTLDAQRIFAGLYGERATYLGWRARDFYNPTTVRTPTFLHVAGKSHFKNTQAVVDASRIYQFPVTFVGEAHAFGPRVPDHEIARLMNTHQFHLMPSAYEGYGQVLHEAQGCGQIVLTTDAPPMNELRAAILIPPEPDAKPHHLGRLHRVTPEAIWTGVQRAVQLSADDQQWLSHAARVAFEGETKLFRQRLDALLEAG